MDLYFFVSVAVVIFLFVLSYRLITSFLENKKVYQIISNFESYNAALQFIMKKSYDITYKDKLLVYSMEATRINDKQFGVVSKDFANLTLKIMGPRLRKEFLYMFGDEETLFFNLVDYFNTTYENDEIRKDQQEKLMNSEETT